jgi:hypothetical protein
MSETTANVVLAAQAKHQQSVLRFNRALDKIVQAYWRGELTAMQALRRIARLPR